MTGSARRIDRDDKVVVIAAAGDLDAFSACNFRRRLELVGDYGAALVVDMTEVDFIDSASLGALVGLARTARDRGAVVALAVSRPGVRSVLAKARRHRPAASPSYPTPATRDRGGHFRPNRMRGRQSSAKFMDEAMTLEHRKRR
jgi:anti-sigma B factor antagonist